MVMILGFPSNSLLNSTFYVYYKAYSQQITSKYIYVNVLEKGFTKKYNVY